MGRAGRKNGICRETCQHNLSTKCATRATCQRNLSRKIVKRASFSHQQEFGVIFKIKIKNLRSRYLCPAPPFILSQYSFTFTFKAPVSFLPEVTVVKISPTIWGCSSTRRTQDSGYFMMNNSEWRTRVGAGTTQ